MATWPRCTPCQATIAPEDPVPLILNATRRSTLPVTVVLDYPQRHRARRLRRSITTLVGGLMVFLGAIASIGLFPSFVYVVGIASGEPKMVPTVLQPVAIVLCL